MDETLKCDHTTIYGAVQNGCAFDSKPTVKACKKCAIKMKINDQSFLLVFFIML